MAASNRSRRRRRPRAPAAIGPPSRYNHADQLAKNLLREALSCASVAMPETEVEVVAASQKIDVYAVPDPARVVERAKLGWLGDLAADPSLLEPFHATPNLARARRVICKQLVWHHELERRALAEARAAAREASRSDSEATDVVLVPFPRLVVISPGRPEAVLEKYGCKQVRDGWYDAVEGLRMRVVVLAELPRTRETLLLRLLGAGEILAEALADLEALPADAWERSVATPVLVHFGLASDQQQAQSEEEEDDVSAEIRAWFQDYQQKLRTKERDEGRIEEARRAVLTALRVRGITVPDAARERILAQKDPERLERWHERAILATSLAEVLDEPS